MDKYLVTVVLFCHLFFILASKNTIFTALVDSICHTLSDVDIILNPVAESYFLIPPEILKTHQQDLFICLGKQLVHRSGFWSFSPQKRPKRPQTLLRTAHILPTLSMMSQENVYYNLSARVFLLTHTHTLCRSENPF